MRVRPQSNVLNRRRARRAHPPAPRDAAAPVAPPAPPAPQAARPTDQAQYACHCGMVFDAAVSTTVDCPHCGTEQAW